MTAAVEASSIRAPDVPVTIHYSTAPVPRYLRLPSTTAPPPCPGVSSYHPLHSYRTVGSPRRRRRPVIFPPKRKSSTATRKTTPLCQPTILGTRLLISRSLRLTTVASSSRCCCRISEVFFSNMSSAQFSPLKQALTWSQEDELPVFTGCGHLPSSGQFCKSPSKAPPSVVADEHVLGPYSPP